MEKVIDHARLLALRDFVCESNRIESIARTTAKHHAAHEDWR